MRTSSTGSSKYPGYTIILCFLIFVFCFSTQTQAADPSDVDKDDDGLIEIESMAELNLMRYNLSGTGLTDEYGVTNRNGCPTGGCNGYELTRNLNFDTNQNQQINDEPLWDNGAGWRPVGSQSQPFTARFEGNHFTIRNLYIDRPNSDYVGLFGAVKGAEISNVVLKGYWYRVVGRNHVGGLAGTAYSTYGDAELRIRDVVSSGAVEGHSQVGGLVGSTSTESFLTVENTQVHGAVIGFSQVGGVAGAAAVDYYFGESVFSNNRINIKLVSQSEGGGVVGNVHQVLESKVLLVDNRVILKQHGDHKLGGMVGSSFSQGPFSLLSVKRNIVIAKNLGTGGSIGGIIGYAGGDMDASISVSETFVTGVNAGTSAIGGMIGYADGGDGVVVSVMNSYSNAVLRGQGLVGGLIGYGFTYCRDPVSYTAVYFMNSYVSGNIQNGSLDGGLIGGFDVDRCSPELALRVIDSYWDLCTTEQNTSAGDGEGMSSSELKCPTEPGDNACNTLLYNSWSTSVWDFGTSRDYPKLRLEGIK